MLLKIRKELKDSQTFLTFGVMGGLGMIAPLVIAKFFSESLFGSYSLARVIIFLFLSILFSPTQTPFIVCSNQERTQSGKINKSFSVQLIFFAFSIAASAVLSLIFNKAIMAFAQISFPDLLFMMLALVAIITQSFISSLFMSLGQRLKNATIELIFGVVNLIIVILLCLTGRITLSSVFFASFLSEIVVILAAIWMVDYKMLLPLKFDREHFRNMFGYSRLLILSSASTYLIDWGGNFVLRPLVGMAQIGNFNLGYQIFKGITMLIALINNYFLPFVSEHIKDPAVMKNYLFNKRPKIFIAGLLGTGFLFVAAPYILSLIYGNAYKGSDMVLLILLIGCVFVLYNSFYIPILNALKEFKFNVIVNIIQSILSIALSVFLVSRFGILGAAVATTIAYFFTTVVFEAYYRIKLKKILIA